MGKLFAKIIVVLSLTVSIGGHWGLLQTIAWANMVLDYSQDRSLVSAISKTFDGETSCDICEIVREGKKQESPQDFLKVKSDLFCDCAIIAISPPCVESDQVIPNLQQFIFTSPPASPPPRLV